VFVTPWTEAVNSADCPAVKVVAPWAIEMLTFGRVGGEVERGCDNNTVAVAVRLESTKLVAQIVT
jgi:hypothetical protein